MRNPLPEYVEVGVTDDCASILDIKAKGTSCSHIFSHIYCSDDFGTCIPYPTLPYPTFTSKLHVNEGLG